MDVSNTSKLLVHGRCVSSFRFAHHCFTATYVCHVRCGVRFVHFGRFPAPEMLPISLCGGDGIRIRVPHKSQHADRPHGQLTTQTTRRQTTRTDNIGPHRLLHRDPVALGQRAECRATTTGMLKN